MTKPRRGGVKFILLHHEGCPRGGFHYRVGADGTVRGELAETRRGQHAQSIAVVMEGCFDDAPPPPEQIDALKELLVQLKMQFVDAEVGAHRQVRGDAPTTCPGRMFPVRELREWAARDLIAERDARIERMVEEQHTRI